MSLSELLSDSVENIVPNEVNRTITHSLGLNLYISRPAGLQQDFLNLKMLSDDYVSETDHFSILRAAKVKLLPN